MCPIGGNLWCGVWSTEGYRLPVSDFRWPVRVYYEDTDSGGVVYYANYLRFMERARTEWMRTLGFEQDALIRNPGILFAVRSASLEYLRPARFNDLLEVSVRLCERRRASLLLRNYTHKDSPNVLTVTCLEVNLKNLSMYFTYKKCLS